MIGMPFVYWYYNNEFILYSKPIKVKKEAHVK